MVDTDKIVSLPKRRGFIFQSSEIYGGTGSYSAIMECWVWISRIMSAAMLRIAAPTCRSIHEDQCDPTLSCAKRSDTPVENFSLGEIDVKNPSIALVC
jgi:hypothetical protein